MAGSPKDIESKIHRILTGWRTLAPDKSFGGMTLAQFEASVQPSLDTRQRIESLEEETRQAIADRENADEVSLQNRNRSSTAYWPIPRKDRTAHSTNPSATKRTATATTTNQSVPRSF